MGTVVIVTDVNTVSEAKSSFSLLMATEPDTVPVIPDAAVMLYVVCVVVRMLLMLTVLSALSTVTEQFTSLPVVDTLVFFFSSAPKVMALLLSFGVKYSDNVLYNFKSD